MQMSMRKSKDGSKSDLSYYRGHDDNRTIGRGGNGGSNMFSPGNNAGYKEKPKRLVDDSSMPFGLSKNTKDDLLDSRSEKPHVGQDKRYFKDHDVVVEVEEDDEEDKHMKSNMENYQMRSVAEVKSDNESGFDRKRSGGNINIDNL